MTPPESSPNDFPSGNGEIPGWGEEFIMGYGLSRRELEVLHWMAEAKSDAEIALILKISKRTVNNHAGRILRKLGVENRVGASRLAIEAQAKAKVQATGSASDHS